MSNLRWIAAAGFLALTAPAPAIVNAFRVCSKHQVDNLNRTIAGRVLDYTDNHGTDRRIWSAALGEKRDLYVYLPPGYDGRTPFPVMFWFHGIGQDEKNFLSIVPHFDRAIRCGRMPPCVINRWSSAAETATALAPCRASRAIRRPTRPTGSFQA